MASLAGPEYWQLTVSVPVMGMPVTEYWVEPVPLAGMVTLVAEIANSGVAHAETLAPINNQHKLKAIRREKGRPRRFMTNSSPPGRLNPA